MSRKFKKGDRITFIDDDVRGVVAFAKAESLTIITDEEIEIQVYPKQVILDQSFQIGAVDISMAEEPKKKQSKKRKKGQLPPIEVDLHIHQLTNKDAYMQPHEKLDLQLQVARSKVEWALQNRIPKLILIHGVGTGVLKSELEYLLNRYEHLTYYDADFKKYGLGATEVYFYQNKS